MQPSLAQLRTAVERIYQNLKTATQRAGKVIAVVHPQQKRSATNLIHYLARRREDLRPLQDELHNAGLSSLASAESHIMRQVQAVLQRLDVDFLKKELSTGDFMARTRLLPTLTALKDILHRSGGHHAKKRYVFRPLQIAERFWGNL